VLTYGQLLYEVRRCAAALRGLGIGSGDRVAIYMPTCAEAIVLMLACARVGAPHLVVFAGVAAGALAQQLLDTVRHGLGPVAVIGDLNFVATLPKTRSGKIMRRVLKAVTLDRDPGDISTIEDEGSVTEAREAWEGMRREVSSPAGG